MAERGDAGPAESEVEAKHPTETRG
jgi:hypothetical protein